MSFASEFAQAKGGRGGEAAASEPQAEVTASEPLTAAEANAPETKVPEAQGFKPPEHGEPFMEGLPAGQAPVDPKAKAEETPANVEPEPVKLPDDKPKPIKIGSREFATAEEAVAYAQELDLASQKDQAYIEGLKDAQKKPESEAPKKKSAYEVFAEKVFEDPVAAAKEFQDSLKQEIRDEYNTSIKQQTEAQRAQTAKQNAWDSFYKANPDLSSPETRDLLEGYLLKSFVDKGVLKETDSNEAFAREARRALKIQKEATTPKQELPSGPVVTTSASGEATAKATAPEKEEKVDFVTQLNRMRRRQ